LVIVTAVPGLLGASLWALTFWSKARVQIGRQKLRYKTVRRIAGAVALIGLPFLLVHRTSIYISPSREMASAGSEAYPNMKQWRIRVVVAIAHLENDDGNRLEGRLRDSLGNFDRRLHITPIILNRTIPVSGRPQGIGHLEALGSANDVGAYVLIWGGAKGVPQPAVGPLYETRFGANAQFGGTYLPTDFKLPELPVDDLCAVLSLIVATQTAQVMQEWNFKFGDALESVIREVRTIAEDPRKSSAWTANARARVNLVLGIAAVTSGMELQSSDSFQRAISYFQQALAYWTLERDPLEWAMTRKNLGFALSALAEQNLQPSPLQEAMTSYKDALAVYQSRSDRLDSANVQFELGRVFQIMATHEAGAQSLHQAVECYRTALKGLDLRNYPMTWAGTQRNLGSALRELAEVDGQRTVNDLEDAIAADREALKVYHKQSAPMFWALTEAQLAGSLEQLGSKTSNRDDLKQSIALYRQVLDGYPRERNPQDWAVIQGNLGAALIAQGDLDSDPKSYQQSAIAYRASLEELSIEHQPIVWATAKAGLGNALTNLGEATANTQYIEEAVDAFNDALRVYRPDREPINWAWAKYNLAGALFDLGKREPGVSHLSEAVDSYRSALTVLSKDKSPEQWKEIQDNLGIALDELHKRGWKGS
jgi:tetratricopeptide (TPR) repeat protein